MPHIWSDDVTTGATYDGKFTLDEVLTQEGLLRYHFVDDSVPMPWIYDGVNSLELDDGIGGASLSFGTITTAKDDPATVATLTTLFDTALTVAGIFVTVTFEADQDQFQLQFDTEVGFKWDDAGTTCQGVWGTRGDADTPLQLTHFLSARHVEPRPNVMEVEIAQAFAVNNTSGSVATLYLPLQDHQVTFPIFTTEQNLEVDIKWRRVNLPEVACPMTNQWHLWFN